MKKMLIISLIILLILPSISIQGKQIHESFEKFSETPESHLIEGVPYVGQDINFHCNLACFTMILKYNKINSSLNEVIYNSCNGYSHYYINQDEYRVPIPGSCKSILPSNYKFLSELYGLSYEPWISDVNVTFEDRWANDWVRIKENITSDIPVMVELDVKILLIEYLGFKSTYDFKKIIGPPKSHYVVLVGYNESNNTVCYNDPQYLILDKPELGTYRWSDLTTFKNAISRLSIEIWPSDYLIKIFRVNNTPLSKEDAFRLAYSKSIERLKGNSSGYITEYDYEVIGDYLEEDYPHEYGINGSKKLREHFSKGINNRIKTIMTYKKQGKFGMKNRLNSFIDLIYTKFHPKKSFLDFVILGFANLYDYVSLDEQYAISYLKDAVNSLNDKNLTALCRYEIELFERESENWTKLSGYYSEFMKKGFFMSLPRGILLMNKMEETMDNIIAIEEAIIAGMWEE